MAMTPIPHHWYRMHGCENHFSVVIDYCGMFPELNQKSAASLQCPTSALGGDGLLIIRPKNRSIQGAVTVDMFNPDGSRMGMCGNGIRCVAEAWHDFTLKNIGEPSGEYQFNVEGRIISCLKDNRDGWWCVAMGKFSTDPLHIPHKGNKEYVDTPLALSPHKSVSVTCVSMGNPHCVIFVDDIQTAPVTTLGKEIENHTFFPKRTNVEFVAVTSPSEISMRVWERGAGETRACGTGACASVVAALLTKRVSAPHVTVRLLGGELTIGVDLVTHEVTLTGPTAWIARGEISSDLVAKVINDQT